MLSKEDIDRQEFEAWFVPRFHPQFHPRHMHRNKMGNYYFMDVEIAWTVWKARSTELLSLREQLAELKALEPVAWILNHRDGSGHIEKDKRVADMFEIFASNKTIPLFTAAKSAED